MVLAYVSYYNFVVIPCGLVHVYTPMLNKLEVGYMSFT